MSDGSGAVPSPRRDTRLARLAPELARTTPFLPIVEGDTPVEPARALERAFSRGGLWVKREDLVSRVYAGNKVRRYEYLLAHARDRGARRLLTVGGLGSTQVVATAILGRALGFDVTACLYDQPITSFVRSALLANAAAGAELIYGGGYLRTAFETLRARFGHRRTRRPPYLIMPGASSPLANLGYVDCALEIADQVRAKALPEPDWVVVPTGSGGTLAGLAVGFAIAGLRSRVMGVRITEPIVCNRATLRYLVETTGRFLDARAPGLRAERRARKAEFSLFTGALGPGYGYPTREAVRGARLVEELVGAPGEVTYTGKAMHALGNIAAERSRAEILYIHTLTSREVPRASGPEALPEELRWVYAGPVDI